MYLASHNYQVGDIQHDWQLTFKELHYVIYFFTPLKLCLATATHNFKRIKNN